MESSICRLFKNEDAIFRVHDSPSDSKIESLIEELGSIGIFVDIPEGATVKNIIDAIQKEAKKFGLISEVDELIIQSLTRASYSHINRGHFGLGFDEYSHFTSPIRRYSDLILHRLIKANLMMKKRNFNI